MGKKKKEPVLKIDQKSQVTGGGLPFIQEDQILPPATGTVLGPYNLQLLSQGIMRSAQAPLAFVNIGWEAAPFSNPEYYNVEWAENSSFTDSQQKRAYTRSAQVEGLKVNQTYYFRVKAVLGSVYSDFSEVLSVLTLSDPTVPAQVTALSATFSKSDLVISWAKPLDEVFKDVTIKIYDITHTTLYATLHSSATQIVWTADQNLTASGGVGLTAVSIDVLSRSWNNVESAAVNTTVSATTPATPNPVSNWTSDTGKADEDLVISNLSYADADFHEITLDSVTYVTNEPIFTYRYDSNVSHHTPTLTSGDPNLSYTIRSKTKLNKVSVAAAGTWINAAPSGAWFSLSAFAGFSQIAAQVSVLSNVIIQDFDHYEWALVSGAVNYVNFNSTTPDVTIQTPQAGSYQVSVKAVDKFNQKSPAILSSILVVDSLTIEQLRAETYYVDDLGATSPALNFLKDDVLGSGTNKVYNTISSGSYHWIEAQRPLLDRYKSTTVSASFIGAVLSYLTYNDGDTNTYYAGPVTTTAAGAKVLTKYTVEATAKSNAFRLDLLGATRIDLPNLQEARKVRINFSNYIGNITFYEYYPRRLVQSDDIEAETIKGINIAASTITADKINVLQLSAITADMGTINAGTLNAVTINGSTINFGSGDGILDSSGIRLLAGLTSLGLTASRAILWQQTLGGTNVAYVQGTYSSTVNNLDLFSLATGTKGGKVNMYSKGVSGFSDAYVLLQGYSTNGASPDTTGSAIIGADYIYLEGAGQVFINSSVGLQVTANLYIGNQGSRYFYDNGTYTRFSTNFVIDGDIYWGYASNWISAYLDQAVKTASAPTFGGLYITAADGYIHLGSNSASNKRTHLIFDDVGIAQMWELGTDLNVNNTGDWYLYNNGGPGTAMHVTTANEFGIAQGGVTSVRFSVKGQDSTSSKYGYQHLDSGGNNVFWTRNDGAGFLKTLPWTTSDRKFKENVKPIGYGRKELKLVKTHKYDLIGGIPNQLGFMADELQAIMPELVAELPVGPDTDETFLGLRTTDLLPVLVNAINELSDEIEELKTKIK